MEPNARDIALLQSGQLDRSILRAKEKVLTANMVGGSAQRMLNIPGSADGGWIDCWSPDAIVKWEIEETQDQVTDLATFWTGPASRARRFVGRTGASVRGIVLQILVDNGGTNLTVQQDDGRIVQNAAGPKPRMFTRWRPAGWQPVITPDFALIFPNIVVAGGGGSARVGYTPLDRAVVQPISDRNHQVRIYSSEPNQADTVVWASPTDAEHNFVLPPNCWFDLFRSASPAATVSITYARFASNGANAT